MTLLVKICGLKTPEALDAALDAGADMVGFVFFPPSPRHLGVEAARILGERVQGPRQEGRAVGRRHRCGTWRDRRGAQARHAATARQGDAGARGRGALAFRLPVMKALPIETRADLSPIPLYAKVADRLLFDARAPREATRPGGLGKPFDWHLLENLRLAVPFMLSGGLDAGNVAEALRITRAPAVDVSSGVERAPGEKDPDKIRAFVRAARAADERLSPRPAPAGNGPAETDMMGRA